MTSSKHLLRLSAVALAFGLASVAQTGTLAQGKQYRDRANVAALQKLAAQAATVKTAAGELEAAQINEWLAEAAQDKQNKTVTKQAVEAGAEQAKAAIALAPNSSEAHRLRGALLGEMIANGGMMAGMRYGAESTQQLDKAIELGPKNALAYVSRAIGYLYTPGMFGGSDTKALEMLHKAIALDPKLDDAQIWLAQALLKTHKPAEAVTAAKAAVALNPDRVFAQYMLQQAEAAASKGKK